MSSGTASSISFDLAAAGVDEQAYRRDKRWQCRDDLTCLPHIDGTRTLGIENQADGIGARLGCCQGVVDASDPAYFAAND